MSHFDAEKLDEIFYPNSRNPLLIGSRESTTLEFKESFSFSNLAEYAKAMASFANKDGGYIVFGIKDNPREILSIDRTQFDNIDQARLTGELNSIFQPAMEWDITTHDWNGGTFGIIYVSKSINKPVIAIKNHGEIKDGEIYFRYRGRSEKIKHSELRQLLDEQIERRNEAWRRVFEKASSIDPVNVAIMDTLTGSITGKGGTVVIDESLIPKLKFIREGDFSQKTGSPTLKLVGDLQAVPVAAVKTQRVTVGSDIYQFRPSHVAESVQNEIGVTFNTALHTKAWKLYKCRPQKKQVGFKNEYSEFKQAENEYRYSQAWIDLLKQKLADTDQYQELIDSRP